MQDSDRPDILFMNATQGSFHLSWDDAVQLVHSQSLPFDTAFRPIYDSNWQPISGFAYFESKVTGNPIRSDSGHGVPATLSTAKHWEASMPPDALNIWASLALTFMGITSVYAAWLGINQWQFAELVSKASSLPEDSPEFRTLVSKGEALDNMALFFLVPFIIGGILWMIWKYKACKNLPKFGARDLAYQPGLAACSYIIPIASYVLPVLATKELVQATKDPKNWKSMRPGFLIYIWWTFYVLFGLSDMAMRFALSDVEELLVFGLRLSAAGNVCLVISGFLAAQFCVDITKRQERMRREWFDQTPIASGLS